MFSKSLLLAGLLASTTVNALPQYGSSGYSSSGSQPMSGSSGSSSCSSGDCGSSAASSMNSTSSCSSGDCGSSSSSSSAMAESTSMADCGSSGCMADSSSMMESSMMDSSMMDSTSTALATSTSMAAMTYSTPSYGSGGMSWSDSGYDGCVQQCVASFGTPGTYYAPTAAVGEMGSSGTGVTHTVVVAPTQGVLRYVPFALNASVGDTVMFMWGANNHTVTKSSELTPCNKTSDAPFASGEQNKSFVFTQVVNDTNPTFFYCGTPGHCEQGMFGIINPPSALNAPTSVSGMMSAVMSNDTTGNIATYSNYTANMTAGSMSAASWGANIDMSSMPSWAYESVVENVMFTRNVLAMNPDMMNADGSVSLASLGSNPMMVPPDVGQALADASSTPSSSSSAGSSSASTSAAPSSSQSATGATSNGAMSVASSKVLVGATVLVATFFAL